MRILVTGADGFVGQSIISELTEKKFKVYGLAGLNYKPEIDAGQFYRADIGESQTLNDLKKLGSVDAVIHSAGLAHQFGKPTEKDFWKVNVLGTKNIAEIAASLKATHFILVSSVAVYGRRQADGNRKKAEDDKTGISETTECFPKGFYAESKINSEKVARQICLERKMALTILRLATVIGEKDKGNVARLIRAIDKRRFIWIGSGANRKSLIYKGDVAKACLKVIGKTDKTSAPEVFNVTGETVKMNEVVSEIACRLERRIPGFSISDGILKRIFSLNSTFFRIEKLNALAGTVETWLSEEVYSGDKFKEVYGFQAQTSVKEAIRRQVKSYKNTKG